jgi:very-short-patch-repair endonuclease
MTGGSDVEDELWWQIQAIGLSLPERQAKIISDRKFRWDFAWLDRKLTVEIQGGIWSGGAHSRGGGIQRDYEKNNLAVLAGWRCLYFTTADVKSGLALSVLERILK